MSRGHVSRREFLELSTALGVAGFVIPSPAFGAAAATDKRDGPWQIGIYTRPWDKYDYRVALDAIAEAGYKYCGLMTTNSKTRLVISVQTTLEEAHEVGREVKARGLKVVSIYGGDIPVAKSLAAGIEGMKQLIDNCAACGSTNLLMGGTGNEKLYDMYYQAIKECCDYAAKKGVGISVKPHGGLNATGPQCRRTIEMVGHENFRIYYDAGNIYYYSDAKLSPVDDAPTVDGLVSGWCIKDYIHPKNVAVTPGAGMVDFAAVFNLLRKGGFRQGPLVVECLEPGDLTKTLAEARKARTFVEALVASGRSSSTAETPEDPQWPGIGGGHYVRWPGGVWNTRKPALIWQAGEIGTLAQCNATAKYLGEKNVDVGSVELDVTFDKGYLAPKGGGKHFMEIMSWVADRSDRQAISEQPWSRIELANLGDRPRCLVWNYGSHFQGRATKIFSTGPAFEPDRWYHIRFDLSYKAPTGQVTIGIDDRSYTESFEFAPGTIGPGRFYLFGHVETEQPDGRMHFRNFNVRDRL